MAQGAENIPVNDDLLSKYFSGEALPEEAMAIDTWKTSNADAFNASWETWNATTTRPYVLPDMHIIWQNIVSQLSTDKVKKMRLIPWLAVASLIAVIAVIGAVIVKQAPHTTIVKASNKTTRQSLPDGSVATVVAGSTLSYKAGFKGHDREILLQGEGEFEVAPEPGKPFIVVAGPVKVLVLGTTFHVKDTDSLIIVQVSAGKVRLYNEVNSIIISNGQMGYYNKRTQRFILENYYFHTENEPLGDVVSRLSIAFQKKIILKDPALASLRITSIFHNKPTLNNILEVITTTLNLKYSYLNADEIIIEEE